MAKNREPKGKKSKGSTSAKPKGWLGTHKKAGSKLLPMLSQGMPITVFDFERDLLPEHLWIGSLIDMYGIEDSHRPFADLLDELDTVWNLGYPPIGLISDFGFVAEDVRAQFKLEHQELIRAAFHDPIGRFLANYPDCPAYWLIDHDLIAQSSPIGEADLALGRDIVGQLIAGKDDFAGHARMLPMTRSLKHGKLHFPPNFPLVDALVRYRAGCNEEELRQVQSFGRMMVNGYFQREPRYADQAWPKSFWRRNRDLVPCEPKGIPLRGARPIEESHATEVQAALGENAENARTFLRVVGEKYRVDLYDPSRDEVLLGLFSRCIRLYTLMCDDPHLWASDTAGIVLRCIADTAITFAYLAKVGTVDEFRAFREYGDGQQKLLMMHLQESHPGEISLEGRNAKDIGTDLGVLAGPLLSIELGAWSKKDARALARESGMEREYRLIFSPGSGDIHGSWASLKISALGHCVEPLHRFHRVPLYEEAPFFLPGLAVAQDLIEACIAIGTDRLSFPAMGKPLNRRISELLCRSGEGDIDEAATESAVSGGGD